MAEAPTVKEPRSTSGILGQVAKIMEAFGYCGLPMLEEYQIGRAGAESFQKEADCEAVQQGLRYTSGHQGRVMNKLYGHVLCADDEARKVDPCSDASNPEIQEDVL